MLKNRLKDLFNNLFHRGLAIDLGTANTLIYMQGKGIILNEPSVIAVSKEDKSIKAVGQEAKEMYGKTADFIKTLRPIKDGVITDIEITQQMITTFILRALKRKPLRRVMMLICVPLGISGIEKRAVIEAAENAGASEVCLIPEPVAAAIGAGLPIHGPHAHMIVDIGGGTAEVAVICSFAVSYWESIRVAGDEMDEAIVRYVQEKFNLEIDIFEAEKVKKTIGCASPQSEKLELEIKGKDMSTEMPKTATLDSEGVRESLQPTLLEIIKAINRTLESISPATAADIYDQGITLAGGSSLLKDLPILIQQKTDLPVQLAEDPLTAVVRGASIVIEDLPRYHEIRLR